MIKAFFHVYWRILVALTRLGVVNLPRGNVPLHIPRLEGIPHDSARATYFEPQILKVIHDLQGRQLLWCCLVRLFVVRGLFPYSHKYFALILNETKYGYVPRQWLLLLSVLIKSFTKASDWLLAFKVLVRCHGANEHYD